MMHFLQFESPIKHISYSYYVLFLLSQVEGFPQCLSLSPEQCPPAATRAGRQKVKVLNTMVEVWTAKY